MNPNPITQKTNPNNRPRLLLADNSCALLEYASESLNERYEIVAKLRNAKEVLEYVAHDTPDLMVLDISFGDMSGIELARTLRQAGYAGKIVFLTVYEAREIIAAAFSAGASAYVVKPSLASDLAIAVAAALSGEMFLSESLNFQPD